MSAPHLIFLLAAAYLTVFLEAAWGGARHLLGAQIDLLPALMVYAGLSGGPVAISLLAFAGGLLFDSISANPMGISVIPLLAVGFGIHAGREFILARQFFAQATLGLAASAVCPAATLILLMSGGHRPLVGWGTFWQLGVMSLAGALASPLFFRLFSTLDRALIHRRAPETSFRSDREIRRGRG